MEPTQRTLDTIVEISVTQDFDPKFNDTTSVEYKEFTSNLENEVTILYYTVFIFGHDKYIFDFGYNKQHYNLLLWNTKRMKYD